MNQAILFSDNEYYNATLQQIEFQAQCEGALITCVISVKYLYQLNDSPDQSSNIDEQAVLDYFESVRFDIEDIAEKMIHEQKFNEDGKVYIKRT